MDKLTVRLSLLFVFLTFFQGAGPLLFGADLRTEPIDAYILIDTSGSMKGAVGDAAEWICARVVDDLLGTGDRVSVWAFSDGTRRLIERETIDKDSKNKIKDEVRKLSDDGKISNIAAALKALLTEAESRKDPRPIAYVLVASSLVEAEKDAADKLLKYSRVEERPGWKAVVVGVGLEKRVAESARIYLQTIGSR
ncbi:MAG: vWA domain-containing protein [Treponemataceae bacterium]